MVGPDHVASLVEPGLLCLASCVHHVSWRSIARSTNSGSDITGPIARGHKLKMEPPWSNAGSLLASKTGGLDGGADPERWKPRTDLVGVLHSPKRRSQRSRKTLFCIFETIEVMLQRSFPADSNPPDAGQAERSPCVNALLDRLDCPPIGKRDLNLFFRDPMCTKASDTNAEPRAESV